MKTLGIVGVGNMGSALIRGLIQTGGIKRENVYAFGHHPEALKAFAEEMGFTVCPDMETLIRQSDALLMAVKPYHIEDVIARYKALFKDKVFLTVIAGGYDFDRYEALLPPGTRHLFIMPNTPIAVGEGVSMFEDKHSLSPEEYQWVKGMFEKAGIVVELPSRLIGAGSAVSGCAPAFFAMAMEALADAGVKYGLPRKQAYRLIAQTMIGTGKLQQTDSLHPGELKDNVCSPLGTTIRGVEALERGGMRAAFMDAVDAIMETKKAK